MKIRISFEFNTEILDEISSDRRRIILLKIEKCMDVLRNIGSYLDDHEALYYPHYQEITTDDVS